MVYEVIKAAEDGVYQPESSEVAEAFIARKELVHFVVLSQRPSAHDCFALLKNTHYSKNTDREGLISLRLVDWMSLNWYIISIPAIEKDYMVRAAAASGLSVSTMAIRFKNGVAWTMFPFTGENVFILNRALYPPPKTVQM